MVSNITRGKVRSWPYKFRLLSSHLISRYSILQKIIMCNWLLTAHCTVVSKSFATLLFQVGMKRKFNLGKLVLEHILGHVEIAAYRKALGYPSLIFGILTAKKPDLVSPIDILRHPAAEMRNNHKLYEGHHFKDVHSGKNLEKMKEKVLETIPTSKLATTPKGQFSSIVLSKSKILDRTIRSYENMLVHLYEQKKLVE